MEWLKSAQRAGREAGQRVLKRHLRLGVTGLSGAGKTALITSLVHQLTRADSATQLALWPTARHERLLGAQILPPQDATQPRFPYEQNLQQLFEGHWPASTTGHSELSLLIRVKQSQPWLARIAPYQELQIDLIDYPGEWLLDLPMLQMDFATWCEQSWQRFMQPEYQSFAQTLLDDLKQLCSQGLSELTLAQAVSRYTEFLQQLRQANALILQPGRLLQPGHLLGTPLLQLLPLPLQLARQFPQWQARLQQHYFDYQQQVIRPFYHEHFAKLDRQIVLVDCLSVLNHGYQSLQQLQQALLHIQQHFHYGAEGFWQRLFAPRIDKVALVASKADQLTPEQHRNLSLFLQQLLQQSHAQQKFAGCESLVLVAASVICSVQGEVWSDGQMQPCIQGRSKQTGELVTLYPGDVPISMPSRAVFEQHVFDFPELLPPGQQCNAMRFDQLLQFLIGDRLK